MTTASATRITFDEAVAEGLRLEMHRDPALISFYTAAGGIAAGLAEAFGPERSLRSGEVGAPLILAACGAALEGRRSICELGLDDAGAGALDQLAELAAAAAASTAPTPITVRLEIGDPLCGGGAASDPLGFLLGRRGLKVVVPSTAADAKGLTIAAVRDDDPVCILEHASLRTEVGTVPEGAHVIEIGHARTVAEGERLTVLAHGTAVAAAEAAVAEGSVDADVLDLRSLDPLDTDAVLTSVRKTGKMVFIEPREDRGRVRLALVAAIWEQAFEYLDAPTRRLRLGGADDRAGHEANVERIRKECDELLSY